MADKFPSPPTSFLYCNVFRTFLILILFLVVQGTPPPSPLITALADGFTLVKYVYIIIIIIKL